MRTRRCTQSWRAWFQALWLVLACTLSFVLVWLVPTANAAIEWDGGAGTKWWFNPVNWDTDTGANTVLPPNNGAGSVTDTLIGSDEADAPDSDPNDPNAEGVVYDPRPNSEDPNFPPPGVITFPSGYGPQIINQLYIGRNTPNPNRLTIKGDLQTGNVQIGRSSGTRGVATNATIVQKGGKVVVANNLNMDIGQSETVNNGHGNGTYDYREGILEVLGSSTVRLSHGTTSAAPDGDPAGAGGIGTFIMHNPATPGYVRVNNMQFASFAGTNNMMADIGDPNGIDRGVAIARFHYENGGTRPIQVNGNLSLNNGLQESTGGTRSSRLDLRLEEPVMVNGSGVPIDLGLFEVVGTLQGSGSLGGTLSSADGSTNLPQGALVSAIFGNTKYNWNISYTGVISWVERNESSIASILGTGGNDIVLIGLSSENIGGILTGDYNNNGVVDAADYAVWRNAGPNDTLSNDPTPGVVDATDYNAWVANFGKMSGSGAALVAGAVPEPSTILLALLATFAVYNLRGRFRGSN